MQVIKVDYYGLCMVYVWFMYGLCMVYVVSGYFVEHSWGKKGTKDVKGKFIPSCFSGRRFTLNLKNRNCNDYEI